MISLTKFCKKHNTEHPNTSEYWYDRKDWQECRLKRKESEVTYREVYLPRKNELQRKRREENPSASIQAGRRFIRTPKGRFKNLREQAKKRYISMELTLEQYRQLLKDNCHYCLGPLNETGTGLDRIDSSKGYSLDNVVACCKRCNLGKHVMSQAEFKEWIQKVYFNFAGGS